MYICNIHVYASALVWKLALYSDSISEYSWNLLYILECFAIVVELLKFLSWVLLLDWKLKPSFIYSQNCIIVWMWNNLVKASSAYLWLSRFWAEMECLVYNPFPFYIGSQTLALIRHFLVSVILIVLQLVLNLFMSSLQKRIVCVCVRKYGHVTKFHN